MLFKDWAIRWLDTYKKPFITERTYMFSYFYPLHIHLCPFFGNMELTKILPVDIQQFFSLKTELSESVLSKFHMILTAIFCTAIDNDLCLKNPVKYITYRSTKAKYRKKVYSGSEIIAVEKYARDVFPSVLFLLETGLRRGELVGLKWSDIDMEMRTLSVNRSVSDKVGGGIDIRPPKWDSYRTIPLSPRLYRLLLAMPHTCEFVFPSSLNAVYSPTAYSRRLARFMVKMHDSIGCPVLTAHELRHTYGTNLRRRGVDIYTIQQVMGHRDINMTARIYVHNEVETLRHSLGYKK